MRWKSIAQVASAWTSGKPERQPVGFERYHLSGILHPFDPFELLTVTVAYLATSTYHTANARSAQRRRHRVRASGVYTAAGIWYVLTACAAPAPWASARSPVAQFGRAGGC